MNREEALSLIGAVSWQGSRPGLERITELLARLGNPQKGLRCLHIAGTNGKGSTAAMLASVFCEAGYRVGLFTSPYVEAFNERIMIDGRPIDDETLCTCMDKIAPHLAAMADPPTEFELITAIGFLAFRAADCDLVVLEVGMGGRLDATNVIENPILSIITGIALDHTAVLGDTVEKIAAEKAGIIKAGAPLLYGGELPSVRAVLAAAAAAKHAPFFVTDRSTLKVKSTTLHGNVVDYAGLSDLFLPLCGLYQPDNLATVVTALRLAAGRGFPTSETALRRGLAGVRWKARFELLCEDPIFIYDGSHNPQGVAAACKTIDACLAGIPRILITAVMADKDYHTMAAQLAPRFARVITLTPDNPRALDASLLAALYRSLGKEAYAAPHARAAVAAALDAAKATGGAVVALGSLYMYREIKEALFSLRGISSADSAPENPL